MLESRDKEISQFDEEVDLPCPVLSGSSLSFKWYKNGEDITGFSNDTGHLTYTVDIGEATGVYQCFAYNSVGSDHAAIRMLETGIQFISEWHGGYDY